MAAAALRAYVEPPDSSWAARRILAVRLEALGYVVREWGAGGDWVLLIG